MATHDSSLVYWIWLSQINCIGPVIAKVLLDVFETPLNIYIATKSELENIRGIGSLTTNTIFSSKSLVGAEGMLKKCKNLNIDVLTYGDSLYPIEVKKIKQAPIILYYRGNLIENSMGIAIVE